MAASSPRTLWASLAGRKPRLQPPERPTESRRQRTEPRRTHRLGGVLLVWDAAAGATAREPVQQRGWGWTAGRRGDSCRGLNAVGVSSVVCTRARERPWLRGTGASDGCRTLPRTHERPQTGPSRRFSRGGGTVGGGLATCSSGCSSEERTNCTQSFHA